MLAWLIWRRDLPVLHWLRLWINPGKAARQSLMWSTSTTFLLWVHACYVTCVLLSAGLVCFVLKMVFFCKSHRHHQTYRMSVSHYKFLRQNGWVEGGNFEWRGFDRGRYLSEAFDFLSWIFKIDFLRKCASEDHSVNLIWTENNMLEERIDVEANKLDEKIQHSLR